MSAASDLQALGADVRDPVLVAKFIAALSLSGQAQAHLLRSYLIETGARLNAEVLVAARDFSYYL
jgi:tRNA A22 N-methylase